MRITLLCTILTLLPFSVAAEELPVYRLVARDGAFEPMTIEGTELLARCVQHETDHLDGVLFVDRLDKAARKAALKEIRESEWFGEGMPGVTIKSSPHPMYGTAR